MYYRLSFHAYSFSKEPEITRMLEHFDIKVGTSSFRTNLPSNEQKIWRILMPNPKTDSKVDVELANKKECDLRKNEVQNDVVPAVDFEEVDVTSASIQTSTPACEELFDLIIEELQSCKQQISDEIISTLHCENVDLKLVFTLICECQLLDFECIYNLGCSLLNAEDVSEEVTVNFFQHTLLKKVRREKNKSLETLVIKYLGRHLQVGASEISQHISSGENSKVLLSYVVNFNDDIKINILEQFLSDCSHLEPHHLEAVQIILPLSFSCYKGKQDELLAKIFGLMTSCSDEYAWSKSFGSLLVKVLEFCGPRALIFEQQILFIMSKHGGVMKGKVQAVYEKILQEDAHSSVVVA